jgi:hypothetical protein
MVITLLACCVLMGFVAADSMLHWRYLFRQINGESTDDLPVPISSRVVVACYVLMTLLWIVGARQAGI